MRSFAELSCEVSYSASFKEVAKLISTALSRPVGVIICGADCDTKDAATKGLMELIPDATRHGAGTSLPLQTARSTFAEDRPVIAVLSGEDSTNHACRHQTVKQLREQGARQIVMVYVEHEIPQPLPARAYFKPRTRNLRDQTEALKNDPPTVEGVDFMIKIR